MQETTLLKRYETHAFYTWFHSSSFSKIFDHNFSKNLEEDLYKLLKHHSERHAFNCVPLQKARYYQITGFIFVELTAVAF